MCDRLCFTTSRHDICAASSWGSVSCRVAGWARCQPAQWRLLFDTIIVLAYLLTYLLTYWMKETNITVYFMLISRMFCVLVGNGIHRPMCGLVGTELSSVVFREIPEPLQPLLGTTTSAGTWHHTLGMSAVSDDAAATSRLLSEVDVTMLLSSSDVKATTSFCYYYYYYYYDHDTATE